VPTTFPAPRATYFQGEPVFFRSRINRHVTAGCVHLALESVPEDLFGFRPAGIEVNFRPKRFMDRSFPRWSN
jgi:hypothetical protein